MKKESELIRFLKRHRSGLIVCALVGEMVVSPAADYHPHFGAILAAFIWLVIILAARYMAARRLVRWVVLPIAALWAIARLLEAFGGPDHFYGRLAPVMGFALSCALVWGIIERTRVVPRTPIEAIAESFIAYLIIAIAFAQLYWILNQELATPFNQVIPRYEISTLLYFSLVTIASVGYGGIAPVNPYVRMVAAFEGVAGIFYVAIVVARLVSAYGGADRRPPE